MVGVVVACSSVSSIKALWETRIRRRREEHEEEHKRTTRGGATGRSDHTQSLEHTFCWYTVLIKVGISKNRSMNLIKITHNPLNWFIFSVGTSSPTHFLFLSQCFYHRVNENLVNLKKDESVSEGG